MSLFVWSNTTIASVKPHCSSISSWYAMSGLLATGRRTLGRRPSQSGYMRAALAWLFPASTTAWKSVISLPSRSPTPRSLSLSLSSLRSFLTIGVSLFPLHLRELLLLLEEEPPLLLVVLLLLLLEEEPLLPLLLPLLLEEEEEWREVSPALEELLRELLLAFLSPLSLSLLLPALDLPPLSLLPSSLRSLRLLEEELLDDFLEEEEDFLDEEEVDFLSLALFDPLPLLAWEMPARSCSSLPS
mmetsp:Transcript_18233/g.70477  ORF Transcript_18233/g.70477 Transcript_18233/m.70477 type:complete len:243 (-) Transcript_18233:2401-3129(-)